MKLGVTLHLRKNTTQYETALSKLQVVYNTGIESFKSWWCFKRRHNYGSCAMAVVMKSGGGRVGGLCGGSLCLCTMQTASLLSGLSHCTSALMWLDVVGNTKYFHCWETLCTNVEPLQSTKGKRLFLMDWFIWYC